MTSTPLTSAHHFAGFLGFFRRQSHKDAPRQDQDGLDRATLRAIRNLPPHLLRDIGVLD